MEIAEGACKVAVVCVSLMIMLAMNHHVIKMCEDYANTYVVFFIIRAYCGCVCLPLPLVRYAQDFPGTHTCVHSSTAK